VVLSPERRSRRQLRSAERRATGELRGGTFRERTEGRRRPRRVDLNTPKLILFDIDGTLILTGGAGRRALDRAFEAVFRVPRAFSTVAMAGRTDPLIIEDAFTLHGVTDGASHRTRLIELYLEYLAEELPKDTPGRQILPGVVPLLEALRADRQVILALLTGNLRTGAQLKLEAFGLWHYFVTGAFGDDAIDRNGLVPVAAARMAALGHPHIPAACIVVVGDTPHDVACARWAGARSVGVATGGSSIDELAAAGADAVLPDLEDTARALDLIRALLE
jgi:phosphoglycolate phosphatase